MLFLKSCPKCEGDVYKKQDSYGEYLTCLQCGFVKDIINNLKITSARIKRFKVNV